ncbi:MAG: ROK family protein [Gemmatimonadaceae bacterium]
MLPMRKIDTRSFVRATRSTPRDINRRIVLNLVRDHEPISRADLARRMAVGRGMVTSLVAELIADGSLYEGATIDAPRGRRPQMLYVRTQDRLVVAVDVRFSKTYCMLTDFSGIPVAMETFDTTTDPDALVDKIVRHVRRLLRVNGGKGICEGVGLVVPGMVHAATGTVLNAPQLGWRNVDVRDRLAEALDLPVHVENAPIACALAQMWLGQRGRNAPTNFVYVTVSDGVGAGVVVNGQVVRGETNTAGEFGHVPLSMTGPECLCGSRGCLEAYTSNLATLTRYLGKEFSPATARALIHSSGLSIVDVIARARSGERRAVEALQATARYLGAGLAVIINTLSPGQIFVGGEIADAWDQLLPTIRAVIASRVLTESAAATPIVAESASTFPRLRGGTALVAAPLFAAPRIA